MARNPLHNSYTPSENFPEEEKSAEEQAAQEAQALAERMQAFNYGMSQLRDEWVQARRAAGIDNRWRMDQDQYNAIDAFNRNDSADMMKSVEAGVPITQAAAQQHRSTVYFGLTRQKTNSGEARLADIVLPRDDRNFGLGPTPNPELAKMLKDDTPLPGDPVRQAKDPNTGALAMDAQGQPIMEPLRRKDAAEDIDREAREKAAAMEKEIEDQFVECDHAAESRKMLHQAAVLGSGALKGPIVVSRTRRSWQRKEAGGASVHVLDMVAETRPASRYVSVWNLWPDPACGDNVQNGMGIFERELMSRKTVRDMAKQPGVLESSLREVLRQGPAPTKVFNDLEDPRTKNLLKDTLFEAWHYTGEVELANLRAAGVEGLPEGDDELFVLSACVTVINNVVVKVYLNPLESGDLPYDIFPWEKDAESVWGFGIPYLMRAQQRVLNAAWRQMMDNAGICAGPQIVLRKGAIVPADGNWAIYARKIWYANDDVQDVEKAFMAVNFDSHQAELAEIIRMAEDMVDKETGQPLLTQGERGSAPETVGGMQLLMNSANVVLRRLVQQYDDYVTKPHVRRYYDYNMAHSPKDEIKGDYEVSARGSSALLMRDVQNQAYMGLLQLAANPAFAPLLKLRELFVRALQAQHLTPDDIVKSEDQIRQEAELAAKNPPQDPRLLAAQARVQEAEMRAEGDRSEIELRREISGQNFAAQIEKLKLQRELSLLQYATQRDMKLEDVRAQLAQAAMTQRTQKELFAAEAALKMHPSNPTNEGI